MEEEEEDPQEEEEEEEEGAASRPLPPSRKLQKIPVQPQTLPKTNQLHNNWSPSLDPVED
jgi:hypothetical protein